jgi:hypothetical protein
MDNSMLAFRDRILTLYTRLPSKTSKETDIKQKASDSPVLGDNNRCECIRRLVLYPYGQSAEMFL